MTRRQLLPLLVSLPLGLATGCASPSAHHDAATPSRSASAPAPSAPSPRPPLLGTGAGSAPTSGDPTSAVTAPSEPDTVGAAASTDETVDVPAVEVPPAEIGSRDPFNSDVVDRNREGELILERALRRPEDDETP